MKYFANNFLPWNREANFISGSEVTDIPTPSVFPIKRTNHIDLRFVKISTNPSPRVGNCMKVRFKSRMALSRLSHTGKQKKNPLGPGYTKRAWNRLREDSLLAYLFVNLEKMESLMMLPFRRYFHLREWAKSNNHNNEFMSSFDVSRPLSRNAETKDFARLTSHPVRG